jgi:uncharacterized phage protein gp47/JayE
MSGSINSNVSGMACSITSAGISAPTYADIFSYLQTQYQGIYGADVILTSDTQDGQWLAVIASVINDCNAATIAAYNNMSPATAQGTGLSSVVKINGLTREVPTNSVVPVQISGAYLTPITNGIIADENGYNWALPASVQIPVSGEITVTATCQSAGAINAIPQTFTITNPQRGWQSAISAVAATPGAPVELDGALRIRQSESTTPAQLTITDSIKQALLALPGVGRLNIIDNSTSSANSAGVPANSLAVVIEGGTSAAIGNILRLNKSFGASTYGNIEVPYTDAFGNSQNVYYSAPSEITVTVAVALLASTVPGGGYTVAIGAKIQAAIAAYITALPIGQPIYVNRLMLPAMLNGTDSDANTYDIISIEISITGSGGLAANNIILAYNQAPTCIAADVTITPS